MKFNLAIYLQMQIFKTLLFIIFALVVTMGNSYGQQPAIIYVSVTGNDNWSGSRKDANLTNTDGPLATLQAAQAAVRKIVAFGLNAPINVVVREGNYTLSQPLVFTPEDAGTEKNNITWQSCPGERVVVSGGQKLTKWQKLKRNIPGLPATAKKNVWVTDVPIGKKFYCLYGGTGLLQRAKSPKFETADNNAGVDRYHLRFREGDLPEIKNIADAEIFIQPQNWVVHFLPIESINYKTQIITTSQPGTYGLDTHFRWELRGKMTDNWKYQIENVVEFLDEPGEWVLNSAEGKLYYWPEDEKDLNEVIMPNCTELFKLNGDIPNRRWVKFLKFDNLTFKYSDRLTWNNGRVDCQHGWEVFDVGYAAIELKGAYNITVQNCTFEHCGGSGVKMSIYTVNNKVLNNEMRYLGGSGVSLVGFGSGNRDENHHHTIKNNNIHHCGNLWLHSSAIYLTNSSSCDISNNHIHDMPYIGIAIVGGREALFNPGAFKNQIWDGGQYVDWEDIPDTIQDFKYLTNLLGYIQSRNNTIQHNDIHHIMMSLRDGNAIYISGTGAGTLVKRNYIHDISMGVSSAIRTDDSQFFARITENVIMNIDGGGLTCKNINEFDNNIVINCIYSFNGMLGSPGINVPNNYGASLRRNIFVQYANIIRESLLVPVIDPFYYGAWWGNAKDELKEFIIDDNLYWCPDNPQKALEALIISQKELGKDKQSIVADPKFFDMGKGDLRWDDSSPAYKLGINLIEKYGLVESVGPNQNIDNK